MQSEEQLWLELKKGNRDAFEMLFHRYYEDLYRYGIKFCGNEHMVEDQIQNLYLKIWMRKQRLGDVKGIKTYLWTALRRELITAMKKRDKRQKPYPSWDGTDSFSLPVEDFIIKKEQERSRKNELKKVIDKLTPKQKEILYLRFYEGMSYDEIEDIMSVNYQVARNYLSQCLKTIKDKISSKSSV